MSGRLTTVTARTLAVVVLMLVAGPVSAQTRRPAARPAVPTPPALTTIEVALDCGAPLGRGTQTRRLYCDVLTGRDQSEGILIPIPPHSGPVTLSFELHNRHLYSEELIKSGRAYRRYTATIGVLTADKIGRAHV